MDRKEKQLGHLGNMLDALIGKNEEDAKKAFHDYVTDKSKGIIEGDDPKSAKGEASVKATMKTTSNEEIK